MSWEALLIIGLGLLFVLFMSGFTIFVSFTILNIVGTLYFFGFDGFGLFTNSLYETTTSSALIAIPLFVLMGELLFRAGALEVLYDSLDKLVGHFRARLYYLAVILATIFGALSGTAMGVVAMLGRSMLPGMIDRGYDPRMSISMILGGASLAPIIPPSVLIIIIASLAHVSVAGLLIAGIFPGLLMAVLFIIYVTVRVKLNPNLAPPVLESGEHINGRVRALAVARMLPFVLIILSVLGSIFAGIATPEESAATGGLGTLLVAALYRKLNLSMLFESVGAAARISAILLAIMMSSKMFGQLLAFSGATSAMVVFVGELNASPFVIFLFLMAIPLILCLFIDQLGLLLVLVPIYVPIITALGFDPIWFWMLFLINLNIGSISPPFGYTIFALKGACPSIEITRIFSAAWPVVFMFLIGAFFLVVFPQIVLFLPSHF